MRIKTAEISIDQVSERRIRENWQHENSVKQEFELLDNTDFRMNLWLPYRMKGSVFYFLVDSRLRFSGSEPKVLVSIYSSITKLLLVSILICAGIAVFFHFAQNALLFGLAAGSVISILFFVILFRRLIKISKVFLRKLTSPNN